MYVLEPAGVHVCSCLSGFKADYSGQAVSERLILPLPEVPYVFCLLFVVIYLFWF